MFNILLLTDNFNLIMHACMYTAFIKGPLGVEMNCRSHVQSNLKEHVLVAENFKLTNYMSINNSCHYL